MDARKRAADAYKKAAQRGTGARTPAESELPAAGAQRTPASAQRSSAPASPPPETMGFIKAAAGGDKHARIAKLLVLLGRDQAALILQQLKPADVERIMHELATLPPITATEARRILVEFGSKAQGVVGREATGGVEAARDMLVRAFGVEEGERRLFKVVPNQRPRRFEFLAGIDSKQLAILLRTESAGVMAVVLANMPTDAAAKALRDLEAQHRAEVVRRMARMTKIAPEVLDSVETRLKKRIEEMGNLRVESVNGEGKLAEILRYLDLGSGERILGSLRQVDAELSDRIRRELTTLEDVGALANRDLQKLLQRVDDTEIAMVLKGAPQELAERLLANVSERRRQMIILARETLGPVRRSDVDRVITDFVRLMRAMAEEGEIVVRLPGERFSDGSYV